MGISFRLSYDAESDEIVTSGVFVLSINGLPIIELEESTCVGVNFSHPMLSGFVLAADYATLADRTPSLVSYRDGWAKLSSLYCWFQKEKMDVSAFWLGMEAVGNEPGRETWQPFEEALRAAAAEVLGFFDEIKGICLGNVCITPNIVPASRKVPSSRELTFLCHPDKELEDLDLIRESSAQYRRLAYSCLTKRTFFGHANSVIGVVNADLVDSVNAALSNHLFLERGYAVRSDIRAIV